MILHLQARKKELEETRRVIDAELEGVEKKLLQLQADLKERSTENLSENQPVDEDTDSPFASVASSPTTAGPLELLPLDKSKRPENIYRVFRQSCSFLRTPQPSAFRKQRILRQSASNVSHPSPDEETPNISRRLQKQLAELFDE